MSAWKFGRKKTKKSHLEYPEIIEWFIEEQAFVWFSSPPLPPLSQKEGVSLFSILQCVTGRAYWRESGYTVKKFKRFFRPQPGCHWLNSPWAGIFPPRESLVSDIPAGDRKSFKLFYSVGGEWGAKYDREKAWSSIHHSIFSGLQLGLLHNTVKFHDYTPIFPGICYSPLYLETATQREGRLR